MASITKSGSKWRVQLKVNNKRYSASFDTKGQAQSWAVTKTCELRQEKQDGIITGKTCAEAFKRYGEEVSSTKRGHVWELRRLEAFTGDFGDLKLVELSPELIGSWRDDRLKEVKGSTINRNLNLLSHVLTVARKEWKWLKNNPVQDVRRPKNPEARDRRISQKEIDTIVFCLGYEVDSPPVLISHRVALAFLFAIETAMRAGEICSLKREWVDGAVVHLPASVSKNETKRSVPLSPRAQEILALLPEETLFELSSSQLDALFRKARDRSGIEDLKFHDTRHEAITRLAQKLEVLDLARMTGHRDINELLTYYNASPKEIAERLK